MVIMDLINGPDEHQAFKHGDLPPTVLEDINNALKKLHEAGLVFGDMRRPNIMLVKSRSAYDEDEDAHGEDEWHGQLIDFNWSGPIGKARYPPTLNNDGRTTWAFGIEPAGLIEKRHDGDVLEKIVIGIDSNE
jgi:RIO-like serine/threonine protein kinase